VIGDVIGEIAIDRAQKSSTGLELPRKLQGPVQSILPPRGNFWAGGD
jgi:hypothetical protein